MLKAAAKSNQGAGKEELEEDKFQSFFGSFGRVRTFAFHPKLVKETEDADTSVAGMLDDNGEIVAHFRIHGERHDDWLSLLQPSVDWGLMLLWQHLRINQGGGSLRKSLLSRQSRHGV